METKEFVEKCFANFENITEEFKDKLVKDLDKVMKEASLDYKKRMIGELLEGEKILIEKLLEEEEGKNEKL